MEYYNGKTHKHIILFPRTAISKTSRIFHALFTVYKGDKTKRIKVE